MDVSIKVSQPVWYCVQFVEFIMETGVCQFQICVLKSFLNIHTMFGLNDIQIHTLP